MLKIEIPQREWYDESKEEFITIKKETLQLEHSLLSISKWESKWNKPFLSKEVKTKEETLDYFKCMTINSNVNPDIYKNISKDIHHQIEEYIGAKMTATWFSDRQNARLNNETITSELVYYWMLSLNIPFECEKWHFNRLITLIRVCNIKNSKPTKSNRREDLTNRNALNKARQAKLNTKG